MNQQLLNVIQRAKQLCQWIRETPHTRGTVNGLAAQVGHELIGAEAELAALTQALATTESAPCTTCSGMGYVDGVGDACAKCNGNGATPEPSMSGWVETSPPPERLTWGDDAPERKGEPTDDVRDAETELVCAEEVLDALVAALPEGSLRETAFDCIGDYITAVVSAVRLQAHTERKGEPVELPELDDESCAVLEFFNKHLEVIGRGEWYAASTDLTDDTPSYRRATIKDAISMSRYWLPRLTKASEAMTRFLCAYEGNGADIGARRKAEKLMRAANTSPQVPEDTERLDWMASNEAHIAWNREGDVCRVWSVQDEEKGAEPMTRWHASHRAAIDAARKGE